MVTTRQILLCSPPTHAQFPQAIGHYEAAIGLDPTEITFRSNLAAVHFETKNYEEVSQKINKSTSDVNHCLAVCQSVREGSGGGSGEPGRFQADCKGVGKVSGFFI